MARKPAKNGASTANLGFESRGLASAFSRANLQASAAIVQQAVGQLPWGHNTVLLARLKAPEWRIAFVRQARRLLHHRWPEEQRHHAPPRQYEPRIRGIEAVIGKEHADNFRLAKDTLTFTA